MWKKKLSLMSHHKASWLGALDPKKIDLYDYTLRWHWGYWKRLTVPVDHRIDGVGLLEQLMAHPSAAFLQELELQLRHRSDDPLLQVALRHLLRTGPHPSLRVLRVHGDGGDSMGDVSALWSAFPNLEVLQLAGRDLELGSINAPCLRHCVLEVEGASAPVRERLCASMGQAKLPVLRELVFDLDPTGKLDRRWVEEVVRQFGALPALRSLMVGMGGPLVPEISARGLGPVETLEIRGLVERDEELELIRNTPAWKGFSALYLELSYAVPVLRLPNYRVGRSPLRSVERRREMSSDEAYESVDE